MKNPIDVINDSLDGYLKIYDGELSEIQKKEVSQAFHCGMLCMCMELFKNSDDETPQNVVDYLVSFRDEIKKKCLSYIK